MYALSPVFGWLTDRVGARPVVYAGQLLFITASILVWFGMESYALITAALVCLGLGWSASTVAGAAMVSGAVDIAHRPQLQGTSDLLMNLSGAAGGLVAGPILVWLGFGGLGLVLLGLVAVVLLVNIPLHFSQTLS
ncbi:MFS transporter [Arthrobacter sp. JCM 19049]|nr:MFS transporter [Arthrobacter sp. JCM 19049]